MDIILYVLAIALVFWAQYKVKGAYSHYSTVRNDSSLTGREVARRILDSHGLNDVEVLVSQNGILSDHFDPKKNTVNLSPKVYNDPSIASLAIAAHEVGHAIQYAENYSMISLRNSILPFAIVSGNLGWIAAIIGLASGLESLFYIGVIMLLVIATFQLITLPIEFDASKRALVQLETGNYISFDEKADVKSMLSAAAFTYVAALLSTIFQILRLFLIANNRRK
jgi:Zn-dependent membrane protease YugP